MSSRPPPTGRLTGVHTLFGAEVEPTWAPDGATAVLEPTRTVRIEVRTSSGDAQPIDFVAGEDHVLSQGAW
ncbi:hypothetical protein ACFV2U_19865 [Streptomyces sp. NPDC059697]|uniref:hypothetical protein n=1 Tax=Streptomyces sp. NPDC059697 TaxID=3346912 RepID=UPI0036A99EDC